MRFRHLPKTTWLLGLASLFADVGGDAVAPLLPVFLSSLGAGAAFIGLFEGTADAIASIAKFISGYVSDRIKNRSSLVLFGYGLAAITRPLMALVTTPLQAMWVRGTDRLGKGIRGAPRDAWLGMTVAPTHRGAAFGLNRTLDHSGAFLGPILASAYLALRPGSYREIFAIALIPGLLSVACVWLATKTDRTLPKEAAPMSSITVTSPIVIPKLPRAFYQYLAILLFFSLGNSSDAFLLLRLKVAGVKEYFLPILWALLNLIKMLGSSFLWGGGGALSDKIGRKPTIVLGWLLYATVYLLFAWDLGPHTTVAVFLLYGIFFGLTEAPERALISDLVPPNQQGSAFGLYYLIIGIAALPASVLFGMVWEFYGYSAAFFMGALLSIAGIIALIFADPAALRSAVTKVT